jgi:hypothetical protein
MGLLETKAISRHELHPAFASITSACRPLAKASVSGAFTLGSQCCWLCRMGVPWAMPGIVLATESSLVTPNVQTNGAHI